jgi:endonuclease III
MSLQFFPSVCTISYYYSYTYRHLSETIGTDRELDLRIPTIFFAFEAAACKLLANVEALGMSDAKQAVIDELLQKLSQQQAEMTKTKEAINMLRGLQGLEPMFADVIENVTGPAATREDEFYKQPLATVVRTIMERRKTAGQSAASVDELFEAMKAGSYAFDVKDETEAKRGIAVSLSKNTVTFHRLPNGKYGLASWYDLKSTTKRRTRLAQDEDTGTEESLATDAEVIEPDKREEAQ